MSVLGTALAAFNVLVIAFGIHLLARTPDLGVALWLLALTYQLSRTPPAESMSRLVR